MVRRRAFAPSPRNTCRGAPSPDDASLRSENHEGRAVASILRDASRSATLLRMRGENGSYAIGLIRRAPNPVERPDLTIWRPCDCRARRHLAHEGAGAEVRARSTYQGEIVKDAAPEARCGAGFGAPEGRFVRCLMVRSIPQWLRHRRRSGGRSHPRGSARSRAGNPGGSGRRGGRRGR